MGEGRDALEWAYDGEPWQRNGRLDKNILFNGCLATLLRSQTCLFLVSLFLVRELANLSPLIQSFEAFASSSCSCIGSLFLGSIKVEPTVLLIDLLTNIHPSFYGKQNLISSYPHT